tara:strand:- start:94 stop:522 length:429 start_codon:yes stop_codon:yes gene_type:complete
MNNIQINFDFNKNIASIKYLGSIVEKKISIIAINNFTKMASISYQFNNDHKWVFNWSVWAEREQFMSFEEYKKLDDYTKDPWKTLAKWSYINMPQIGTVQTNDVRQMSYQKHLFPQVGKINFTIIGSPYGSWDNNNILQGYY